MYSFDNKLFIFIIGAITLRFSAFYLRRLQKPMRPKVKKNSSLLLTKYTENHSLNFILFLFMLFAFFFSLGLIEVKPKLRT
jgi:hypothetical protein